MRVLIVGSGAVGGTFGAKLTIRGHDLTFIARGEHGRVMRERGLRVSTADGELLVHADVLNSVHEAAGMDADVALICVKWHSLADVLEGVGRALARAGVAIPLLNGLYAEERVASAIQPQRVIGGVAQLSAKLVGPGTIKLHGGAAITLAPFISGQADLVSHLALRFGECFHCSTHPDVRTIRWRKLLWNAPFNAICALTGKLPGDVLAHAQLGQLARAAIRETVAVAEAEGVDIDQKLVDRMLAVTRDELARTEPSMLVDVEAGRPTEADHIQGAVVACGRNHGIETPVLETLHALLTGLG